MANITIEYMILVPLLILQIFLLPYAASLIMTNWSISSETLALQDASSRVGSSIQQVYFFMNHATVPPGGNVTSTMSIPRFINNYAYTGNATLTSVVSGPSSKVLTLTLKFMGNRIFVTSPIGLGQNVQWTSSSFMSNSTTVCVKAYKDSSNLIWLSFGA